MFTSIRSAAVAACVSIVLGASAASAAVLGAPSPNPSFGSYLYPPASTNADNFTNGLHYVELIDSGVGFVELNFVNPTNLTAFFEYRADDEPSQYGNVYTHPTVAGDYYYFYKSVGAGSSLTMTFTVTDFLDVRSAFGPERDYDFDWTRFEALPSSPVPLPAGLPLLAAGLGLMGVLKARRRPQA